MDYKKYFLIAPIRNFRSAPKTRAIVFGWTFTNDPELIKSSIPNISNLKLQIGEINTLKLFNSLVAFKFCENEELAHNIIHYEAANLNAILHLIWFLKDNSVFANYMICQNVSTAIIHTNTRNIFYTTSSGNNIILDFKNQDFIQLNNLFLALWEDLYSTSKNIDPIKKKSTEEPDNFTPADIRNDYHNLTRIQRANYILSYARTISLLPMRIALYINVLECLILNDNAELNFKLQIFTSNFIGKSVEEKNKIRDLINKTYAIRSKFYHGSKIKEKHPSLVKISTELDYIIRRTFFNVFPKKEIFNDTDNKKLTDYFKSILFS